MKELIRRTLRARGFDIVRYMPEIGAPFDVLPIIVRDRLTRGGPFFFVQIGANDGMLDDPLRTLILDHKLTGLLVEPLPDMFELLQRNYAGSEGLIFENVAIASEAGLAPLYRVARDSGVPASSYWHGLASFSKRHLLKEGVPEASIERVDVRAVTLQSLLVKHRVQAVDLLQVDAEGYDYEVVRSAVEGGCLPRIINYEHCHLVPSVRAACWRLLDEHGYRFIEVGKDTLAMRPE